MNTRRLLLLLIPVLVNAAGSTIEQRTRIRTLEETFLAPCCWAEPIARHRSEVALQMRAEIAHWVAEGKSDRQIKDTYKQRYGARVLVEPEGSSWWWMHVVPWVVLLLGLTFTVQWVRRLSARTSHPQAADAAGILPDLELGD